jgi:hypothetical protein
MTWLPMHNDLASDAHDLASDAQILSNFQIYSLLSFSIFSLILRKENLQKKVCHILQHLKYVGRVSFG